MQITGTSDHHLTANQQAQPSLHPGISNTSAAHVRARRPSMPHAYRAVMPVRHAAEIALAQKTAWLLYILEIRWQTTRCRN